MTPTPENIGTAVARKLFDLRGNHSEIHIGEAELASAITAAIKLHESLNPVGIKVVPVYEPYVYTEVHGGKPMLKPR